MYTVYWADDTQGPAWSFAFLALVREYKDVVRIRRKARKLGVKIMARQEG